MAPTLTLSRAAVVVYGVSPTELQPPVLTPEVMHALEPVLVSYGFDITRPIQVQELPDSQGFHLMQ